MPSQIPDEERKEFHERLDRRIRQAEIDAEKAWQASRRLNESIINGYLVAERNGEDNEYTRAYRRRVHWLEEQLKEEQAGEKHEREADEDSRSSAESTQANGVT